MNALNPLPECEPAPVEAQTLTGATASLHTWTAAEEATLRTAYAEGGAEAALAALPGRSRAAVYKHANRLFGPVLNRPWTEADDNRLRMMWDAIHSVHWIARKLNRTPAATRARAGALDLPLGCPQGYEYLSHAARRTGYSVPQLRRILEWSGMPTHRSMADSTPRYSRRMNHVVDPLDVDDAIAQWLKAEPVCAIARRLHRCPKNLKARLRALGLVPPPHAHLRVTDEQVQQALAIPVASLRPPPQEVSA